jgi:hypothetical protein
MWILGDYFLSRFYSIYNINLKQIGLAKSISYDYLQTPPSSLFGNSNKIKSFSSFYLIIYLYVIHL